MKTNANAMVHNGLVARIGAAIEMGKCFSAKNANIQDVPTMADLLNSSKWSNTSSWTRKSNRLCACRKLNPNGMDQTTAVMDTFSSNTAGTALLVTAFFLAMSYKPRKRPQSALEKTSESQDPVFLNLPRIEVGLLQKLVN